MQPQASANATHPTHVRIPPSYTAAALRVAVRDHEAGLARAPRRGMIIVLVATA
jgi:hypothetical protein